MKLNESILNGLKNKLITEGYKEVKNRFIKDGTSEAEVKDLLDTHKILEMFAKDLYFLKRDIIHNEELFESKVNEMSNLKV